MGKGGYLVAEKRKKGGREGIFSRVRARREWDFKQSF